MLRAKTFYYFPHSVLSHCLLDFCLMNSFNFWQNNVNTTVTLIQGTGRIFGRKKPKLLRLCRGTPVWTKTLVEHSLMYLCIVFTSHYSLLFNEMSKNHKSSRTIKGKNKDGVWPLHWKEAIKNRNSMYPKFP